MLFVVGACFCAKASHNFFFPGYKISVNLSIYVMEYSPYDHAGPSVIVRRNEDQLELG